MLPQVLLLIAQSYTGPPPAKPDVPYLLQAGKLIATEVAEATESKTADGTALVVAGANSPVKTPLVFPIFILRADKLAPEKLLVLPADSRDGHREILSKPRPDSQPFTLTIQRLKDGQYRLEVDESLSPGEYALMLAGAKQAFCFAIY
jgi:hypothetical protein